MDLVNKAYRSLSTRRVDLVGDYAGRELFLIDGDSLLLRCFCDRNLDFDYGLQLLHAVYNVELFLHNLLQRNCCFNIVFFESNKSLCAPAAASPANKYKYYLARAVIIQHLKAHLMKSNESPNVLSFSSWTSPEFTKYVTEHTPYFFMVHDGAQNSHDNHTGQLMTGATDIQQHAFRQFILYLIQEGYNVALVNGLEWHDTKVLAFVLESKGIMRAKSMPFLEAHEAVQELKDDTFISDMGKLQNYSLTLAQTIGVVVIQRILGHDNLNIPKEQLVEFCRIFLQHQALIQYLPLQDRRIEILEDSDVLSDFMQLVAENATTIVQSLNLDAVHEMHAVWDIADFIDGRLLLALFHQHMSDLEPAQSLFRRMLRALGDLLPDHGLHDTISSFENLHIADTDEQHTNLDTNVVTSSVLPFSNPIFDTHLQSVHLEIDAHGTDDITPASRKVFREISHWHNAKIFWNLRRSPR